jgi:hypothetical protein
MRIGATCHTCGRDFLFFQLYNADPWQADKCPHCSVHMRLLNVRPLALAADRALASLVNALEQIAERSPGFSVDAQTVLARIEEAVDAASRPATKDGRRYLTPTLPKRRDQRRAA